MTLVDRWIDFMESEGHRPPDHRDSVIDAVGAKPDFIYEGRAVVYVDGDGSEAWRPDRDVARLDALRDLGYRVIRFGHPDDWFQVCDHHRDIFTSTESSSWDGLRGSPPGEASESQDREPAGSAPAAGRAPLPRNLELVADLLAADGAMSAAAINHELIDAGVRISVGLLEKLPDRYPDDFARTEAGLIDLALRQMSPASELSEDDDEEPRWWVETPPHTPIARDTVVVVDIETTGLDRESDSLLQIAALPLDGGEGWSIVLPDPAIDPDANRRATALALDEVRHIFSAAGAIAGHRLGAFDVPFLDALADRTGVERMPHRPILDLHTLSLLVDPTLASRTLADLAHEYGVPLPTPHVAINDATATASLIRLLLDRYDPSDASWALCWRVLAEGEEAWARVLPPPPSISDLAASLAPVADPLATPGVGSRFRSAEHAAHAAFPALEQAIDGFRTRSGQRSMTQAVASHLDNGGQLLVEAPTGTGKSLAYLIPATGRAGKRGQPVVVATHTKVLQRQLRRDALRLRELGLLPAPFRQIQGVGNYLCTREIAGAIEARDAVGSEWLAVAIAIRALAISPNGVWDDIGDGLLLRSDLAYRRRRHSLRTTANACERRHCEWVDQCPLFERLHGIVEDPGVVSANHALVAAWSSIAREGGRAPGDVFAEGKAAVIFDEAHNLEDSLTAAWTTRTGLVDVEVTVARVFGRYGPARVARQLATRHGLTLDHLALLDERRSRLGPALAGLSREVHRYLHEYAGREPAMALRPGVDTPRTEFRALASAAAHLARALSELRGEVGALAEEIARELPSQDGSTKPVVTRAVRLLRGAFEDLTQRIDLLYAMRDLRDSDRFVHLLAAEGEEDPRGTSSDHTASQPWTFERVPVEISTEFRRDIADRAQSLVLTSATLTVDDNFDFLASRLGLDLGDAPDTPTTLRVESPFDHDSQAIALITSHLPAPVPSSERAFVEELAADQTGFLSLSRGRSLGLFAARTRMEAVAALVRTRETELRELGVSLLVQGESSIADIERRFIRDPGTTVFGLASFWEGFDAPGDTLSFLMIEKPPYPHPGDALVAARQSLITDRGGDPFIDYVVPRTAIRMAQGAGRLIRQETDRGAVIIADRRLAQPTSANHMLLSALPTRNVVFPTDRADAWTRAIEFVDGTPPDLELALALPLDEATQIIEEHRLAPGQDPVPNLRAAAKLLFGIDQLRPFQLALMTAILDGRDALGFVPTGSGKSLCFQLPALLHPQRLPTVVVSPLVALIKDQVDELRSRKGLRLVSGITSRTTAAERSETLRDLADGNLSLLYLSPERLVRDGNLQEALNRQQLGALVIDEAHCVSSWGHDFRPEFRLVSRAVLDFKRAPRLGLTATATPTVEQDLIETLELDDPLIHREPTDRPDLSFWVREFRGSDGERQRTRELLRFILHQGSSPGIVYAHRRDTTEELGWLLRKGGWSARAFHAGLVPEQREAIQEDFLAGTTQIIVATKAFGMGVNKPDVGWVVHFDLPESLESYAQEAGRAARDPALVGTCALFFTGGDIRRRERMAGRHGGHHDPAVAQRLLDAIRASPRRGDDHVVDPEALAGLITTRSGSLDLDELNVLVSWLEATGNLVRRRDCAARGAVTIGMREPADSQEKRRFFRIMKEHFKARAGQRKLVDFTSDELPLGLTADELEQQLLDWSFDRLVDFRSTARWWRVSLHDPRLHESRFRRLLAEWEQLERDRFRSMRHYARSTACRRVVIGEQFGDVNAPCTRRPDLPQCDVCSGTSTPPWHAVPLHHVPDPEELVDVAGTVLASIAWASHYTSGSYGEAGLRLALCGHSTYPGGRPLGKGYLNCPQFGALRYLRGNTTRLEACIEDLLAAGLIDRTPVGRDGGATYHALTLTNEGRQRVGIVR